MAAESDMLESLREVFSQLANEDGLINVEEFIGLACDQVGVSREQASDLFAHLDPHGKGTISLEDIHQSMLAMQKLRSDLSTETSVTGGQLVNGEGNLDDVDSGEVSRPSLTIPSDRFESPSSLASGDLDFEGSGEEEPVSGMTTPSLHSSHKVTSPFSGMRPQRTSFSGRTPGHGSSSGAASHEVSSDEERDYRDHQVTELSLQLSSLNEKLLTVQEERDSSASQQKRIKREYSDMKERLHLLEEQVLEVEAKRQASLQRVQEQQKVKMAQMENRKSVQLESVRAQLSQAEETISQLQATDASLRQQLKDAKEVARAKTEQTTELKQQLSKKMSELRSTQEQQRREKEGAAATIAHLEEQLEEANGRAEDLQQQNEELKTVQAVHVQDERLLNTEEYLRQDVDRLQKEIKRLRERNEELSGQLVQQGKMLMDSGDNESLAAELEEKSKDEIMEALKDEKSYSARLHQYISNLLAVVVEKSPYLLEIKPKRHKSSS